LCRLFGFSVKQPKRCGFLSQENSEQPRTKKTHDKQKQKPDFGCDFVSVCLPQKPRATRNTPKIKRNIKKQKHIIKTRLSQMCYAFSNAVTGRHPDCPTPHPPAS
jgi:hypothetical protein